VSGLTGKVITTRPGVIEVLRNYKSVSGGSYRPGDVLWVYTYEGEGSSLVWHNGKMYAEDVPFLYERHGAWNLCAENDTCWGKTKVLPKSVWWVKVKSAKGVIGWSNKPHHFGNIDACG